MAFMEAPKSGAAGDFLPILAYLADAGRMFLRDREQDANGEWHKKETDITMSQPQFAIDFGRLEVGWCHFVRGAAPLWAMIAYGQPMPSRPSSPGLDPKGKALEYRNGFRVPVAGSALGGVREFAGNSAGLINGMNEVHTQFEASPEAAQGKIPVVKFISTIPVTAGQKTNFQPVFQIVAWVDRPEVLGPRTVPAPRATAPVMNSAAGAAMAAAQPMQQPMAPVPVTPVAPAPVAAPVAQAPTQSPAAPSSMPF